MTKRLLQGQELEQRARELDVDIQGSPRTGSSSGIHPRAEDHELQQRVIEAERAKSSGPEVCESRRCGL